MSYLHNRCKVGFIIFKTYLIKDLNQYLEHTIKSPNYPDPYPNYYEEVRILHPDLILLILMLPTIPLDKCNFRPGSCCQTMGSPSVLHLIHSTLKIIIMMVTVTGFLTAMTTMFTSRAGAPPPLSHWTRNFVTMATDLDQTPDHSPAPISPSPSNQIHLDLEQGSLPWLPEM